MGIHDRDYMRERGRREKPFAAPKQGPSLLTMMLSWVAIALLVYRGYQWLDLRNLRHAKPMPTAARQPQSGQVQDWIRVEREAARSRQFALRC
jgi:hypothetical protein